ncbi:MAG TPA: FUSC family protein [Solirubrobacteraceae bacterium]|nr:FUSC family protein [Solirubrobacteraceae bacterium]
MADAILPGRPFFAPVAAIITLGITAGQHGRRALEIGAGVTAGIAIADTLVQLIGSGPLQLTLIVLLASTLAVLAGGSALAVSQTAVSAAFVVVLEQPDGFNFARTGQAAVGVACAMLMSFVLLPIDPLRLVRAAAAPLLDELAATLHDIAAALESGDHDAALEALRRARRSDPLARDFAEAISAGRETAIGALPRRRALRVVDVYTEAAAHLDLAARNVRVLGRATLRAIEIGDHVPPGAAESVVELSKSARALHDWLDDPEAVEHARRHAVAAARIANEVLELTANLSISVIVGTVRSAAVDFLRGTGMSRDEALDLVRTAGMSNGGADGTPERHA